MLLGHLYSKHRNGEQILPPACFPRRRPVEYFQSVWDLVKATRQCRCVGRVQHMRLLATFNLAGALFSFTKFHCFLAPCQPWTMLLPRTKYRAQYTQLQQVRQLNSLFRLHSFSCKFRRREAWLS